MKDNSQKEIQKYNMWSWTRFCIGRKNAIKDIIETIDKTAMWTRNLGKSIYFKFPDLDYCIVVMQEIMWK